MHWLIALWFNWVENWGLLGVALLMAMESSIFPVPSEVVIPPAVYWAVQGKFSIFGWVPDPQTGFWLVVLAGTVGSWLGSAITYWVSLKFGRAFIERFGKWVHITPEKIDRAERFVHRYEAGGIFFARLLPVVRHLISIPAGLVGMNFRVFSAMTVAGSFLWCLVLAKFSQYVFEKHQGEDLIGNPETLIHVIKAESHPIIAFIVVICGLYFLAMKLTAPKAPKAP
jgi:membrane protein DedA with SNARE-associated domain